MKEMNKLDEILKKIAVSYESKLTRPLTFSELALILTRFQIMLDETPDRYSIEEFIQQEDYRRELFPKQ
jgi:hypothetical protein